MDISQKIERVNRADGGRVRGEGVSSYNEFGQLANECSLLSRSADALSPHRSRCDSGFILAVFI